MFIYHFNRLIRNRILWGFFAIVIAFAFVAVDSCRKTLPKETAGQLNGKSISSMEFRRIETSLRGFGRNADHSTPAHVIDRRAWEQIAAIGTAEANGMAVTDSEIQQTIREFPAFQGANGFDINLYRQVLRAQGLNEGLYEDLVRDQLAITKSAMLANTASWVSPMELEDELAGMTDKFTVQVAAVSNRYTKADMNLTEENYKKYYEEHKDDFALPDQVQVKYVALPASNFVASVTVSDAEIQDYYDSNADKYTRTTTNNVSEAIPLDEVRDKITEELKLEAAVYTASTSAQFQVFGKLDSSVSNSFEGVLGSFAKDNNLTISISPMFSATDNGRWVGENAREFISQAFELDMESSDSRFAVVEGTKKVYVMELVKQEAAHVPEYDKVKVEVKNQAVSRARSDAFDAMLKDLKSQLEKSVADGKGFEDSAKALGMNVSTSVTYSVSDISNAKFENNFSVAYGAMSVQKGKISDPIPASSAKSLLVYVQDRQEGDALAAEMARSQVRSGLARRASGQLFNDWLSWNLGRQKLETKIEIDDPDAKSNDAGDSAAAADEAAAASTTTESKE